MFFAFVFLIAHTPRAFAKDAPIADAAEKQNVVRVATLIAENADVNATQVDGMTALHWATYYDDAATTKLLLEAKANVRVANRYGVTPLTLACTNGNEAIVRMLLDAGANPNTVLRGGETALMTAARTGRLEPVKALLARGVDVNATEMHGQTAIMWAAAEGHADVVEELVDAGADFRTPLDSGFTPLFFAVREGQIEVVKVLLKAGADVNEGLPAKRPMARAASAGTSPLVLAIENGHFELAKFLLEAGADPNDQRGGYTALHTLTWVRKPPRGDGEDGAPPPIGSGNMTSLEIVKELVAHGANVNVRLKRGPAFPGMISRVGATPFLLAAATADVPLLRTLHELGADPLLANADNCTPLMAAAGVGTRAPTEEAGTEPEALESLELILQWGGDVNTVDKNGETAMHGAAFKSFPQVVQWLDDHGAKMELWNAKNKYGWTPLLIAQGHRHGNFKPSAETIEAIESVMRKHQ